MAANTSGRWSGELNLGRVGATSLFAFAALVALISVLEQVGVPDRALGFVFVITTLAVYAMIGVLTRTLQVSEFYVAARRVPALHNGLAAAGAWAGSAMVFGLAGAFYALGQDASALLTGVALGFVLIAVLIAPFLRKFGAYTVPDFLSARFGGWPARLTAAGILIVVSFALLVVEIRLSGLIAARFLGIGYDLAIGLGVGSILIGAVLGGMRAATWTQAVQYVVLLIAFVLPLAILSADLYGWPVPQLTQGLALQDLGQAGPGEAVGGFTLATGGLTFLEQASLAVCVAAGIAGLPHLVMRFFTVTSVRQTRRSVGWTLLFVALVLVTAPAYAVFATLATAGDPAGADQISAEAIVLALPALVGQPFAISALVAAGGLAATLSTAMALLVAVANTLSHDVCFRTLAPGASTAGRMVLARIAVIVVAGLATWGALARHADAVDMAGLAVSLAAAGLFPALVMGIWWRRCTSTAAVAGMLVGFGLTLAYVVVPRQAPEFAMTWLAMTAFDEGGLGAVRALLAVGETEAGPVLGWPGIPPIVAGVLGLPAALVVMVLVSLVQRRPRPDIDAFVDDIRTPRGLSYMARERAAERRREIGGV